MARKWWHGCQQEEDFIPEDGKPLSTCIAYVTSSCGWWAWEEIEESSYSDWVETMKARHQKECGCLSELDFFTI